MARDSETWNFHNLKRAQFQFLGDGPARNEADAESGLDRGLDGFGGIEVHHVQERFELEASLLEGDLDDASRAGAVFAHKEIRGQELIAGDAIGAEGWRGDQDQLVLHKGLGANSAVAGWAFDEADGQLVVEEQLYDLAGVAALQRKLDARVLVEEGAQQARENVLCDGRGNAEGQPSGDLATIGTKLLFGLGNECRYLFSVAEQERPLWSEGDAIGGAIEKANTEIVFESFDLKRDGGLGEEKMFRGFAKIEMLGDGAKNLEAKVFELGHAMIIHGN